MRFLARDLPADPALQHSPRPDFDYAAEEEVIYRCYQARHLHTHLYNRQHTLYHMGFCIISTYFFFIPSGLMVLQHAKQ